MKKKKIDRTNQIVIYTERVCVLMEGLLLTSNSSFLLKVVITDHRPPPHKHT